MLNDEQEKISPLSVEEVREKLSALSLIELAKLMKIAKVYSFKGVDSEDLIQETIKRCLDGVRKCPENVDFLVFLAGAMKSVADGMRKKIIPENDVAFSIEDNCGDIPCYQEPSPEQILEQDSRRKFFEVKLKEVYNLFEGDESAIAVLKGQEEGLSRVEFCENYGMDIKTYNTTRRRIRRALDKAYPEGWMKNEEK